MKHERDFKLKVYPSLGFSLILPFIFFYNELREQSLEQLADSRWYLSIYFSMIMIPTIVMMLKYSGKYKGAWLFKTVPLKELGTMTSGTLKAFLVKLFLPIYLVLQSSFCLSFHFAFFQIY